MSQISAELPADAPWVVLKFGGTSVARAERWEQIAELVAERRGSGFRVLVVVSALTGVTNALQGLCAEPDLAVRARCLAGIREQHVALADAMRIAWPVALEPHFAQLTALIDQMPVADERWRWQAQVLSHGELLSSTLGQCFLTARCAAAVWLDSRAHLTALTLPHQNARAQVLSAPVAVEPDPALAARLAGQGEIFIAPGFVARNAAGDTVLLGRGGSDTSAACFGALLHAARVETWTDVAGMFSANPRQVPGARLLRRLDYEEAQEIASTGAGVLHPRCLSPLKKPGVPLWIRDTARPALEGTVIGPRVRRSAPSIKAISSRRGITLVSMETVGMWQQVGFMAAVFEIYRRHGLSVDMLGSAETNVTVSLDPSENLLDSDAVAALATDLAKICRVKVIAPCATVTLVGRGMRSMLHYLSSVLEEFDQLRVHMISQSSNDLNLTFVVDEDVVDGLLPRLHELLLRSGSLRADDAALFGPSWQSLYGEGHAAPALAWWREARASLLALARADSPQYVYHLPTIRRQLARLKALRSVDELFYAVKANTHPRVVAEIAAAGLALECVSPCELARVAEVAPGARRLFTPSFAARSEYEQALASGAEVTLDALFPLAEWGDLFADADINLRVDLGRGLGHHEKVRTGGKDSKFGLALDQLDAFLALAARHGARVTGLHAHLGSGVLDAAHWSEVLAQLASLADRIDSVAVLNIGGGLGVPAHPGEAELDLAELDRRLGEVRLAYPQYRVRMEPGRFLVAQAGVLLARVTQTKAKGQVSYLGVDAGMHNLLRPALYDAWHAIVNLDRLEKPADTLYHVVGPICESGDVLGRDRHLPAASEGDVILVADAGAYGASMASNYNLRGMAKESVLE